MDEYVAFMKEYSREKGINKIAGTIDKDNEASRKFFKKNMGTAFHNETRELQEMPIEAKL